MAVSRNDYVLTFGEVFETSFTFWDSINSFSVHFAILLTLCHTYCCTWPTITKAFATPTNVNAHMLPVSSKVMRCVQGIHCEYIHLVHVRMHTPNMVSALGPLSSRSEKQIARLHVLVAMCKLSNPGSEPP